MNENPTPNEPPLSEEQQRIKELESEVVRLRSELERANEFKDGYKALYVEKEDWVQVEKEMKAMMESSDTCSLEDLLRQWDAEENIDAA